MENRPDTETQTSQTRGEKEETTEMEDMEKLESEVKEMAERILHYRATLPDQLKHTLSSVLASRRPVLPTRFETTRGPDYEQDPSNPADPPDVARSIASGNEALTGREDPASEKLQLLKLKMLNNASAMPIVSKRMKECMERIDKLESNNESIHPTFKRKRNS